MDRSTKTLETLAHRGHDGWRHFVAATRAGHILAPYQPQPSVLAIRYRNLPSLGIGFADYLTWEDQAHWGYLADGRRVVVIRRLHPMLSQPEYVHLELIQGRPRPEQMAVGDELGLDHFGLRLTTPGTNLVEVEAALFGLDGVSLTLNTADPGFERLKIVYQDDARRFEFKLTTYKLWDLCAKQMLQPVQR